MTSELQVLDLVVNGPIKAHIRNLRAEKEAEDESELMSPPKTNLRECIVDAIRLFSTVFTTEIHPGRKRDATLYRRRFLRD